MNNDKNDKPFFDLDALISPEGFIGAAETEDELGCVLRMHLCLERFLDEFYEKIIPSEHKKFHSGRQFGGKLSLAVAYGLSAQIAEAIYEINRVRNDFAHKPGSSIADASNKRIAKCVNDIIIVHSGEVQPPVESKWVELCSIRPGEKLGWGKHGSRIDFVLACSELLRRASLWIVIHYVKLHPELIKA